MKKYLFPDKTLLTAVLTRPEENATDLNDLIRGIFAEVKTKGDQALFAYAEKFDKVSLESIVVSADEVKEAIALCADDLKRAIETAASNIRTFHETQQLNEPVIETMPGVKCWRKAVGIEKVGLYIPGGSAPLFSTVLMLGIPAQIANCKEVILCTPANKEGKINPAILFAANLVGISKIYKVGGAQAIAALTFGTETIPNVYKIFGPGNQYVTAAKQFAQQFKVAIDMPAGPSEVLVVADEFSNADFVAADLLSQAEHGADSQVVLLTDNEEVLYKIESAVSNQLAQLPRKDIAEKALENSSLILLKKEEIINAVNNYAPEHLILNLKDPSSILNGIINAGSVFIGAYTPESAGDYASGTNHTLPTNGYAKQYSGVSLDAFVKKITFQEISKEGLKNIGKTIEIMAENEQLEAHKNAVSVRLKTLEFEV
jgi:histidinol dehydrogenase